MFAHVLRPRDHHRVRDESTYRRRHREFLQRLRDHGVDVHHHLAPGGPKRARIDLGSWIVDCDGSYPNGAACRNGAAADPEWGIALCYACGREHQVVFPEDQEAIEEEILKRPYIWDRFWEPGETVEDLRVQNREHGVRR